MWWSLLPSTDVQAISASLDDPQNVAMCQQAYAAPADGWCHAAIMLPLEHARSFVQYWT